MELSGLFLLSCYNRPKMTMSFVSLGVSAVSILVLLWSWLTKRARNPFSHAPVLSTDSKFCPTDRITKRKLLKQAINKAAIPENLDAIVIGSGIGGLCCAALLAKSGKRVLVVEQLEKIGGCTHVFSEKSFEFDVGLHYIGQLHESSVLRILLDQISDKRLRWVRTDEVFDTVILEYAGNERRFDLSSNGAAESYGEALLKQFPDDEDAIRKYLKLVSDVARGAPLFTALKLIPWGLAQAILASGILSYFPVFKLATKSVYDVVVELTQNRYLQIVLMYACGDYGTVPENAPFTMHAMLVNHFINGAYYPRGGSSEIACSIVPTIEAAGGKVLANARVTEIITDEDARAIGVKVAGRKAAPHFEIYAPVVISDAGVVNTFTNLLAKDIRAKSRFSAYANSFSNDGSIVCVTLFVGLNGSSDDLGLKSTNYWAYESGTAQKTTDVPYFMLTLEEALLKSPPLLFISFPSAKDKETWASRFPGSSNCVVIACARWDWFSRWQNGKSRKRAAEYENLKNQLADNIWSATSKVFPQLSGRVEYSEIGTPITFKHYINAPRGELYGLDHSFPRFTPQNVIGLRPETDIAGLYLTGQDVMLCGFAGAAIGGLLCASAVLERNLFFDLYRHRMEMSVLSMASQLFGNFNK